MSEAGAPSRALDALRERIERAGAGSALDADAALAELDQLARTHRLLTVVSQNGVEQFERGVQELSILGQLGKIFDEPFDIPHTAEALLRVTAEALPCENAIFYGARSEKHVEVLAVLGTPTADAFAIAEQMALQCHREGRTFHVPDVFEDSRFHDTADRSRLRSLVATPLSVRGEPLGAIVLGDVAPEAFPDERIRVLAPIADIASGAVGHARIWEENRRKRQSLEASVAERTREVMVARAALSRQERSAAMGRLAASIAHEVNNPMSFLVSNLRRAILYSRDVREALPVLLELLDAVLRIPCSSDSRIEEARTIAARAWYVTLGEGLADASSDFGALLAEAEEGATRVQRVGEDLRDFAQGIAGVVEGVDLNRLVETALHVVAPELKDVHFELRLAPLRDIRCQRYEITQVLMTLLENAAGVGVSEGPSSIRVTTRELGSWIEVEIAREDPREDGDGLANGIEATHRDALANGGLGTNIAQDIVDSHGGSIDVQVRPEGRVLTLRLRIEGPGEPV